MRDVGRDSDPVGRRAAHARVPLVEEAAAEPRQAEGLQQNISSPIRFRHGGHGGGPVEPAQLDSGPHRDAGGIHGVHHLTGSRPHARAHDQHLHPAQHRGRGQPPQHIASSRVAARETPLVHRNSVGLLHAPRADPIPHRDSDPLLG